MNRVIDKVFVSVLLFCGLFATLVGATPVVTPKYGSGSLPREIMERGVPASRCSPESQACCHSVHRSDGSLLGDVLGLVGGVVETVTSLLGVYCMPINIAGIGQNECQFIPVCCENMELKGLLAVGCMPININL
ncbi:hypothetical protein BDN71DRAFT_1447792 [Pleurotus eryngii]|uniref:Hydrophobin n=1 Tax=Pleurotus eryngii TaxID=5323 RepID=A0A9P6D6Z4_PLEER|nr:hypothetical protein BDN71DRAFT_1447792 [Pleurotus eryngii]